jgi:Leucine-rich repeat (LRR) protein
LCNVENKIGELSIDGFPELLHFEARGNLLQDTGKIVAPKLQRLYLAGNQIEKLSIENKMLQVVHLRGNKICSLDGISEKLLTLTYLNLRSNNISTMDEIDKLKKFGSLKILILSDNPISQLAGYRIDVLERLPKLDRLDKELVTADEREEVANVSTANLEAKTGAPS